MQDGELQDGELQDGVVVVTGTVVQADDMDRITQAFSQIPGIQTVETDLALKSLDIPTQLYFNKDSGEVPARDIGSKLLSIKQLLEAYPSLELRLIGYRHLSEQNANLALERAQKVQNILADQGIDRRRLQAVAGEGLPPGVAANQEAWLSQCVLFEVIQVP